MDASALATGMTKPGIGVFPETADIETSSDDYARRFAGKVGDWFLKVQEEATLQMLASYPGASVLDVGGGHGQTASALVANGYPLTVFGSDSSCSQRIQPLIDQGLCQFHVGNILALPYPDQAFDVVLSYRLLAHVTHWQQYLAEMARVARCAIILDYASKRSINAIAPYLFRYKKHLEGNTREFTCFNEQELLHTLAPTGFQHGLSYGEFFLPMVLHRAIKQPAISIGLESIFRISGLTRLFGSPVILKLVRTT